MAKAKEKKSKRKLFWVEMCHPREWEPEDDLFDSEDRFSLTIGGLLEKDVV